MKITTVYKIMGIAFILGSLVYFYFAWTNLNFAFPFFSGGMALGGIIFLTAGLVFLLSPIIKENKKRRLLQSGIPIETTFLSVDLNWHLEINNQHPYIIQSVGVDTNGQQRIFKSENIWFNPQPFIYQNQKIKVLIDPNNPKKYWMDISFLENKS